MVDSDLVAVGGEVAAGVADRFVVPEAGGEGEQALGDASGDAAEGATAVTFERELVLERVEDRFDPLAGATERAEAQRLVLSVGAHEPATEISHELLELAPGKALVGEHDAPFDRHALEDLGGRLALGHIGRRELETDRHAVRCAQQKEPKAPKETRVRAAIAVAGMAGQGRATSGLARLSAGHRGRIE